MRQLIQYIAQYNPSYPTSVQPASPDEINRLTTLVKRPLPRSYLSFLESMGHGLGDFSPFDEEKDFSINTVIEFYEDTKHMPPEQVIFIAFDRGTCGFDLFLEDLGPTVEPQVVEFPSENEFEPTNVSVLYESLPNMFFSLAFAKVRLLCFPFRAVLFVLQTIDWKARSNDSRLEVFVALSEKMGFKRVPFTGAWSPCYERGDAGMLCYQAPGYSPYFAVGATTENEANRLAEILCDALALVRRE